jgi:hypothetical protein
VRAVLPLQLMLDDLKVIAARVCVWCTDRKAPGTPPPEGCAHQIARRRLEHYKRRPPLQKNEHLHAEFARVLSQAGFTADIKAIEVLLYEIDEHVLGGRE